MTIACGLKYVLRHLHDLASGMTTWSFKVARPQRVDGVAQIARHLVDVRVVRAVGRPEVRPHVDAVCLPKEVVVVPKLFCHCD